MDYHAIPSSPSAASAAHPTTRKAPRLRKMHLFYLPLCISCSFIVLHVARPLHDLRSEAQLAQHQLLSNPAVAPRVFAANKAQPVAVAAPVRTSPHAIAEDDHFGNPSAMARPAPARSVIAASTHLSREHARVIAPETRPYGYKMARVPIAACTPPLHCDALLHVESNVVTRATVVYAGLMFSTIGSSSAASADVRVPVAARHAARDLSDRHTARLASELVASFAATHGTVFTCRVDVAAVQAAISRAAPIVMHCLHTGYPSCYDDFVVASC